MWLKTKVLLWKSLQLRKRHLFRTLGDVLVPCLLFIFMTYIKSKAGSSANNESVINETIPISNSEIYFYQHFHYHHFGSNGYFVYAPNTTEAGQIMASVAINLNIPFENIHMACNESDLVQKFKNYYMVNNFSRENSSNFYGFGIVFEEIQIPHTFKYKIRNTLDVWNADKLFPVNEVPGSMNSGDVYLNSGFLALQLMLDKSFINLNVSKNDLANRTMYSFNIQSYPYIKFIQNSGIHQFLQLYFPIITIISFLVMCTSTNKKIIEEKYSGVKELMKMMGLESWMIWTGWIIHNVMTHAITIIFITYICCFEIFKEKGPLLTYTNPLLLWILLLIYLIAGTFFSFVFSSIIHRPIIAVISGYLAWTLSFFLPEIYIKPTTSNLIKILAMLLPNTAINFGIKTILSLESMGVGLTFTTLFTSKKDNDSFSIGFILFMLIFDCFIYGFIAWYVDSVMPGKYGIAKPLNFMFKWSRSQTKNNVFKLDKKNSDKYFESPPSDYEVGISIKNLHKQFGNFNAVNGVDLDLYKGQITALLGHNGAGKTTTMSIITGLFSPTSGSVEINGKDIFRNIGQFKKNLGLCPQHNLLFSYLTTLDHLIFFGMLKGLTIKKAKSDGLDLLKLLNILNKKNELVSKLSGGMKRKLSLAIALIGDPEVLILDEPTSGMDPESRRSMWDLLLSFRGTRTVLITTHFMEEADVLGDRIAIMDHGQVKCYGTSLFLKKLYGTGYNLTIVKDHSCNVPQMMSKIQTIIPEANVYRSEANQTIINLPSDNVELFTELFDVLESKKQEFSIKGMGISCTKMEDVFLKAEKSTMNDNNDDKDDIDDNDDNNLINSQDDYQLVLTKDFGYNLDQVTEFVKQHVSGSSVLVNTTAKTIFNLPVRQIKSFKTLCSMLNYEQDRLKLASFEIMFPNMGDVYAIPLEENGHGDEINNSSRENYSQTLLPSYTKGKELLINQLKVLLEKKFLYAKRTWILTLILGIISILFGILAVLSSRMLFIGSLKNHGVNLSLNTYMYSSTYYRSGDEFAENLAPYFATLSVENNATVRKLPSTSYIINDLLHMCAEDIVNYRTNLMIAGDFNQTNATFIYNNIAFHTPAIAVNLYSNALLRKTSGNNKSYISTVNEPLIIEQSITMCDRDNTMLLMSSWLNTLVPGFLFLIACFVALPLSERVSGIKHLQIMTKLSPIVYWTTCFLWDYLCYIIFVLLTLVAMYFYDTLHVFTTPYEFFTLLVLLLVYGWSSIFYAYLYSFFNKTQLGSILMFILLNYILGMCLNVYTVIIKIMVLELNKISLFNFWNIVRYILLIIPNFSFASCIAGYLQITWENNKCRICKSSSTNEDCFVDSKQKSYFEFASDENKNGILEETLFLLFSSLLYVTIILLFDYKVFARLYQYFFNKIIGADVGPKDDSIDSDVNKEISRVEVAKYNFSNDESLPILLVDNLVKKFNKSFTGVRGISFGVSRGECFGLLGVNGAGKTSTFQMLTGNTFPSQGAAYVRVNNFYKLRSNINQYGSMIGYCPQFNAINDKLTGKETLKLMAILRGVPPLDAKEHVDKWIKLLGLEEYKNKLSGHYSGGNKRKLNTAMALIGDPPIVFLDEPTSGVDPASRRNLWKLLTASRKGGQAIVLTSHSMDECEALCSRLAIMVDGVIKCVGNIQYLKNRYGQGFTIMIKLTNDENNDLTELKKCIEYKFSPDILLKDEHKGLLHYHATNPNLPLSLVFGKMNLIKGKFSFIEDYTIGDTTLEQVFIAFAKRQAMPNVQ